MRKYGCKFFDRGGRVVSAETIEAAGDTDALAQARVIQAEARSVGFEIRDGQRLVASMTLGREGGQLFRSA